MSKDSQVTVDLERYLDLLAIEKKTNNYGGQTLIETREMHVKHLHQFNNERINLEVLAEEAAEVIQRKCKISRFGLFDVYPGEDGMSNQHLLEREIGDFLAMVEILVANGTVGRPGIEAGRKRKLIKLEKWYGS